VGSVITVCMGTPSISAGSGIEGIFPNGVLGLAAAARLNSGNPLTVAPGGIGSPILKGAVLTGSKLQVPPAGLVQSYLGDADPRNPLVSPLYGDLAGLPAIRVHVGEDEVLLDDSRRYVERAIAAGVDARLDVWAGMPHGFANGVGRLEAAAQALEAVGAFIAERLAAPSNGSELSNNTATPRKIATPGKAK
jgi:hypothetical protein